MTVRAPLYYTGSGFQALTTGEVTEWVDRSIFEYGQNPSVVLTVAGSGGAIGTMNDTRLQAGAVSNSSTAFPPEGTTAEPSTVTVNYDKVVQTLTGSGAIGETADNGISLPCFYDTSSGKIQAMNVADLLDTFCYPAINKLITAAESDTVAGTYTVSTSSSLSGYTEVSGSATAIFSDTRADTSAYSAAGIPETLDQPVTITNYYLLRRDGTTSTPSRALTFVTAQGNIQEFSISAAATLIGNWVRFTAAHDAAGNKVSYTTAASGSGNVRGTSITDTKLNGTGNYQTLQVGDDYRAQEFPNGTATTVSTYNLRINKS